MTVAAVFVCPPWEAGPLTFRDRAAVPPRDVRDGSWRVVPGGTAVRRGTYLGASVVVMPPSYINIGAWIGDETMVDSHVLVGSCAQIGARVSLPWRFRRAPSSSRVHVRSMARFPLTTGCRSRWPCS